MNSRPSLGIAFSRSVCRMSCANCTRAEGFFSAILGVSRQESETRATPASSDRVEAWQTYRPGLMPRGRLLDVDQTTELADKGIGNATIYLRGDFTVTAARDNRAVLRPHQSLADHVLNRGNARIIVEYPRGIPTPREGETFQRATDRPFQIVDVRRGADGQVNIYVREVTSEE